MIKTTTSWNNSHIQFLLKTKFSFINDGLLITIELKIQFYFIKIIIHHYHFVVNGKQDFQDCFDNYYFSLNKQIIHNSQMRMNITTIHYKYSKWKNN